MAKVILHHGVGTNGRQMSLILGGPLAAMGFETVALDDPGAMKSPSAALARIIA